MNSIEIGHYLSELRKYYKMTQDELAGLIGVSRQAISKWECGSSIPDIEMLLRLSRLYGVSVNDIAEADVTKIRYAKDIILPEKEQSRKQITVIGCGRWGAFLSWYLDRIGHSVRLYGKDGSKDMKRLYDTRKNEYVCLPDSITLTTDILECQRAEIIVISIPAQNLGQLSKELSEINLINKTIVLCMKGIEITTGRRLSQVVSDTLDHSNRLAVWLGPGHVQEFYRGVPNCMVIDSNDTLTKRELISCFSSELIRFYFGTDMIGNEIGAAAKNVIGIAAGILEGMDLSSLKGALMARGTREIARLIEAMGGNAQSAYGLCHLGDYEATVFSPHSQNLAFGKCVALGKEYPKLAEGYYTAKALRNLAKSYGIEMPICNAVYQILYEKKEAGTILEKLFSRSLKREF